MNDMTTAMCDLNTVDSENQVPNEIKFFYQAQNDINIYHITLKRILPQDPENSDDYYDHDYEFFFQSPNESVHVKCKLLSSSLIVNFLNERFYGVDFDANDLKCKYYLTPHQKLNLEQNLRQILPMYFPQQLIPD